MNRSPNIIRSLFNDLRKPITVLSVRGFKHRDTLHIRCDGCYFKNIDNQWFVLCTKMPRHKQAQRVGKQRDKFIVSERVTNTYPAFKKRFMHPGQILN